MVDPMPGSVPPWQMGAYIGTIGALVVPATAAAAAIKGIFMHNELRVP